MREFVEKNTLKTLTGTFKQIILSIISGMIFYNIRPINDYLKIKIIL